MKIYNVKIDDIIFTLNLNAITPFNRALIHDQMTQWKETRVYENGYLGLALLIKFALKSMRNEKGYDYLMHFDETGLSIETIENILELQVPLPTKAKLAKVAWFLFYGTEPDDILDENKLPIEGVEFITTPSLLN